MRNSYFGAVVAALSALSSPPVWGQVSAAVPAEVAPGITSYPPTYFDEFHPTTALSMVTVIPGFTFDGGGAVRGQSANAGNVLVDGQRPPAGSDNISSVLSRIPASAVERIDLIRGGAPGIDMMGKPVVANVIRKRTARISGAVIGGVNADNDGDVSHSLSINAQRRSDERALDGSVTYNYTPGTNASESFRTSPSGAVLQDAVNENTFLFKSIGATGAHERPLLGGNVRVNGRYSHGDDVIGTTTRLIVPGGEEISTSADLSDGGELGLRYSRNLGEGRKVEVVFLQQLNERESESRFGAAGVQSIFQNTQTTAQSVLTGTLTFPPRGHWTFDGGAEAAYNSVNATSRFNLNGASTFIPGDDLVVDELRAELFATGNWTPSPKLSGQIGFRFERSTLSTDTSAGAAERTLSYFKPRANLSWRPAAGHEITALLQRTVGQLSFGDFAVSASPITGILGATNPNLEPAKTWTFDLRYQRTWGRRGNLTVQYNYRLIDDLLGRIVVPIDTDQNPATPPTLFDITANVGTARARFYRVSGNFPLQRIGLANSYLAARLTYRDSQTVDPVTSVVRRLSNETPFDWEVTFVREHNQGKFIWQLGASDRAGVTSFNPRSIGGSTSATSVNAAIAWRPTERVVLTATASTSFGNSESYTTLYLGPRNTSGVRYTTVSHSDPRKQVEISLRRTF